MGWYPERIEEAITELDRTELGQWETPFALAFDCDDSTSPFTLTPRIIREANEQITNDKRIIHTDLETAIAEARDYLADADLEVMHGEMRYPEREGLFTDVYSEIQATRLPLKMLNHHCETALQRVAEPLATVAWASGSQAYPRFALDRANRFLLQNHAHDSIGGCGRDSVARDVAYRFEQSRLLADAAAENAACAIAGHIDTAGISADEILLVVFNPLPRPQTRVVTGEIDIARARRVQGFRVLDDSGRGMPVQIIDKRDCQAIFNHPHELPLRIDADRWTFLFEAPDVPGLGYRVFRVDCAPGAMRHPGTLLKSPRTMANDHLRVTVNGNGSVDIESADTGIVLREQNLFQDRGESGDYWVRGKPVRDRVLLSAGANADISVVEDGLLACTFVAQIELVLPIRGTYMGDGREAETRPLRITTRYRLVHGERFLRITTTVENTVEDHVLRALFPTGIRTDTVHVQSPFDVVERAIPLPDTRDWREAYEPTQPQGSFVDLSDGDRGVAILNRGLPQYDAVDDEPRTIALTLLRAHRAWNSVRLARYPDQTGTQLLGLHTLEYAVFPHLGNWVDGGVMRETDRFNVDPIVGAAGPGPGTLPLMHSFLTVAGNGLAMDTLKQGEWDASVVLRLSNPTPATVTGTVHFGFGVERVDEVNLLETEMLGELPVTDSTVQVVLPSRKVLTLRVLPAAADEETG